MEKDFEELKTLFQQKKASVTLSQKEVELKAKTEIGLLKKNHYQTILTFVLTSIAIIYIDTLNAEKMITSITGFWLLLGCALYYALIKSYLLYRLNEIKPTQSVLQTIHQLERYKKLNAWMATYGEIIYLLILSLGVYLYLQPVIIKFSLEEKKINILWIYSVFGAYFLWTVIYMLVIKRRQLQKDIRLLEKFLQSIKTNL